MATVDNRPEHPATAIGEPNGPGFHQCWYVVALASELDETPLLSKEFLGGRVVVYRTADGMPTVLSAYCAHVGADLGVGKLDGDEVECAFHRFRYGPDGKCTWVPGDNEVPEKARVFAYPAAEQWGAIWAFNGPEPLYDVPAWRDYAPEQLATRCVHETDPFSIEPWIMITNSWDFLHLRELHGLEFEEEPQNITNPNPYVHEYDTVFTMPNIGTMHQRIRQSGTNTVALCATLDGEDSMSLFERDTAARGSDRELQLRGGARHARRVARAGRGRRGAPRDPGGVQRSAARRRHTRALDDPVQGGRALAGRPDARALPPLRPPVPEDGRGGVLRLTGNRATTRGTARPLSRASSTNQGGTT